MVELEPNSCRICLTTTQANERQLLFTEEATLSDIGLLYEEVLSLPIANEGKVLKFICNSCYLQLKLFKELKSKALETHLLQNDICDLSEEYLLKNCFVSDNNDIKIDIVEQLDEADDYSSNGEALSNVKEESEDTYEELEEIQFLIEEPTPEDEEDDDEVQDEEYLVETEETTSDPPAVKCEKTNAYACFECKATFKLKTHLVNHKKRMHPKTKRFTCSLCPKTMYSAEALEVHLNLHNGLPAYKCDVCEKTFKQKAHYNYHMLNHRNERNIICNICQKRFISKSDLKIHTRVHTDERRYKCDICAKTFRAHTHMINHRYSHFEKQFECPACLQKYVSPNTLRTHFKAVHMGEVPHECEFCEKKFKRKHHLHAHYKTHNKGAVERLAIENQTVTSDG